MNLADDLIYHRISMKVSYIRLVASNLDKEIENLHLTLKPEKPLIKYACHFPNLFKSET